MPSKLYRKKALVVRALQWTRDTAPAEMIQFANYLVRIDDVNEKFFVYDRLHDSWVEFFWNDYIIRGLDGEFYPHNGELFAKAYDEVLDSEKNTDTLDSDNRKENN